VYKYKASILLKTNRTNENTSLKKWSGFNNFDNKLLDDRFKYMITHYLKNANSFIEPTIKSLINTKIKNIELVIVHRNPDVIYDNVIKYEDKLDIKLVKEKHSPWHDAGDKYPTISNAVNTGLIWSDGEMIISVDDCIMFYDIILRKLLNTPMMPESLLYNIVNNKDYWKHTSYESIDVIDKLMRIRTNLKNARTLTTIDRYTKTCYGYCTNVKLKHFLNLNGYNETLDGAMHSDDGDFTNRYYDRFEISRYIPDEPLYFFGHDYNNVKGYDKGEVRDNKKFMYMIPRYYKANRYRPDDETMEKYKEWHLEKYGKIDKNFDLCKKVPTFKLSKLRNNRNDLDTKQVGERII